MPIQELVANFVGKAVRRKLHGRDHLVVPTTMIVEGVHNGSKGPLFYPAEELRESAVLWNSRPVPLFHPKDGKGRPISACTPESLEKDQIGFLTNTKFDETKKGLVTETWLDEARTKALAPAVHKSVLKGEVVEVSTGLFTENTEDEGEWNGEKYVAIARNYKPDHLAVLPGLKGACSIEDGAGLGVNERAAAFKVIEDFVTNEVHNEQSHDQLRDKLYRLVRAEYGEAWTTEVFDDHLIYELGGKLYSVGYVLDGEEPKLKGDSDKVQRVVEYRPLPTANEKGSGDENDMDKKKLVDGLIANAESGYEESEREMLMKFTDEKLKKIVANTEKATVENEDEEEEEEEEEPAPVKNQKGKAKKKVVADDDAVENALLDQLKALPADKLMEVLPPQFKVLVGNAAKTEQLERKRLISVITANSNSGRYTEDKLKKKDMDDLRDLAAELSANSQGDGEDLIDRLANYGGQDFHLIGNTNGGTAPEGIGHPSQRKFATNKAAK